MSDDIFSPEELEVIRDGNILHPDPKEPRPDPKPKPPDTEDVVSRFRRELDKLTSKEVDRLRATPPGPVE